MIFIKSLTSEIYEFGDITVSSGYGPTFRKYQMGANKQVRSKSSKKVKTDSFLKKEWRHVYVPGFFGKRDIGFTVSHKCARGKTPGDYINGRCFELSHGDVSEEQSHSYRLFKWKSLTVQNDDVLTYFAGMRVTRDKLCSILRKYRTLIEAQTDVRTADGFILRVFGIAFTKLIGKDKKASYAQQSKRRAVRDAMIKIMNEKCEKANIAELCKIIVEESIEKQIVDECKTIWQVEPVLITKVKVLKAPTLTSAELSKVHQGRVLAPVKAERPAEQEKPAESK